MPLTDLRQDTCGQGHRWSRCGLTLCLATDAHCSSCLQCGATVNNALTISVEAGGCVLVECVVVCGYMQTIRDHVFQRRELQEFVSNEQGHFIALVSMTVDV